MFDKLIEERWGTSINPAKNSIDNDNKFEEYSDEDEDPRVIPDIEDAVDSTGRIINQQPMYDRLLNAEVLLHHEDDQVVAKVVRRALGPDGKTNGVYDTNPFLNTLMYEIEFPDGTIKEYGANLIAENMVAQADEDGFTSPLMKCIIEYEKDPATAIPKSDNYVVTKNVSKRLRKTTQGWRLLVQWGDQSESWICLKDMKEAHPVETSEFSRARNIDDEPAFAWWVPYTLRKRDVILSKLKARVRKTTHKYGIEIPTSIAHAKKLDEKNGNLFWMNALNKEMLNVGIAFELLEAGKKAPPGWSKVTGHLVWDVKMDFTRKARWVLDGHKTPDATTSTFAGVVSRESFRIAFTYTALKNLDVYAADVQNAYLQAPSSRKDYIICGPKFGLENVGKIALIHRALYGGKTAGRDFRNNLRACMRHLHFTSCPADPDVWMRPAKRSDGSEYYEYILLYTEYALSISENPDRILRCELGRYFQLKEESIGPPDIYLGGKVRKVQLQNGVWCWGYSSLQYAQAAVNNVKAWLTREENKHW